MTTSLDPAAVDVGLESETKDEVAIDGGLHAATTEPESGLDHSLARGIAWQGSVKWIVQLVMWGEKVVVARILSPQDYGLLAMGSVLLAFIALLSESGIGATIVTVRHITAEQIAQINGGAVLLGLASFTAACLAAFPVGWFYHSAALPPVIIALSFTLII